MNQKTLELIEFNRIIEWLESYARTEEGKSRIRALQPEVDPLAIERRLRETSEARSIVDGGSSVPIHSLTGIHTALQALDRGAVLTAPQCESVADFLRECHRLKQFMGKMTMMAPNVSAWALTIDPLDDMEETIRERIVYGEVADDASPALHRITKSIRKTDERLRMKLEGVLRDLNQKGLLQEQHISQRGGRYVVAVKSAQWRGVAGAARDRSASGSTVFIEPEAVRQIQDELDHLMMESQLEKERILSEISAELMSRRQTLEMDKDAMVAYDVVIAKGRLSKNMEGIQAELRRDDRVVIRYGRHPLLGNKAVPLDYELPKGIRGLIITGPNTGGKTVVLKTVGLFVAMTQSGLHVPAERGTSIGIFMDILADIGDGQSLAQNLSTFSAHMTTIAGIIRDAGPRKLVLLDEMGSGTDPAEGMGLAAAILEELQRKGAVVVATTHFVEIKRFGDHHAGFVNGAMGFDLATLSPRYELTIGRSGQSHGLHIAERLGLPEGIIARAREIAGKQGGEQIPEPFEPELQEFESSLELPTAGEIAQETVIDKRFKALERAADAEPALKLGDAVRIPFMDDIGVIVGEEDRRGEFLVQIHGKRVRIGKKRLKLYIDGSELYPEDYDLDIVTKSKMQRKLEKKIRKGHTGIVLVHGKANDEKK